MNDDTGRGLRWAGALAAAMAGTALLVAACGGGSSSAAAGSTPEQKAVAYAQCMRSRGEPSFPDPNSQGNFDIPANVDPNSPSYLSANKACEHLNPSTPMTAAQQREVSSQALKWAVCIRSHGIPNFPDPVVNANGMRLSGHGPAPTVPQFQAAQQACRKLAPLGGL
jgi:hypothetical protein